ncbi:SDR family NAD(P)-dependent oxidoreductase [Eudoraea chungangensis]|uniref:SDR family NAD(P)-dependent oxidoreductase n=1 Tax=Eudoraea chungangensis TaxID=1481905 RepID=UPI0023EB1A40|nr:SDR family oxidoreductase [Eudoraea chungangensis]
MSSIDQKILVTGASKGIGLAIAKELLREDFNVALHYNTGHEEVEQLTSMHMNCASFQADLEDPSNVITLMDSCIEDFKRLDTIVLNAGVFLPHPIEEAVGNWYSIWKKTIDINLNSIGLITKIALEHFIKNGQGRLIYIGSRAAFRGETSSYLAYAASKGGLTSLARSVARSFGKYNIKSFVIAPGFTKTAMAEAFINTNGEEELLKELALNELTTPEDIAPLVKLICSGQLDHATGTTIDINGGSYIH